jgi:hypothetical protein
MIERTPATTRVHRTHERGVIRRTDRVDGEGEGSDSHHRPDSRIVEEGSYWTGENDEESGDADPERERPPKSRRPNLPRCTVGLHQSGAHAHVPQSWCERREGNRDRGGAVVGRLEEACEHRDRHEASALYAGLSDELPKDTYAYRALYMKSAFRLSVDVGWRGVSHPNG